MGLSRSLRCIRWPLHCSQVLTLQTLLYAYDEGTVTGPHTASTPSVGSAGGFTEFIGNQRVGTGRGDGRARNGRLYDDDWERGIGLALDAGQQPSLRPDKGGQRTGWDGSCGGVRRAGPRCEASKGPNA